MTDEQFALLIETLRTGMDDIAAALDGAIRDSFPPMSENFGVPNAIDYAQRKLAVTLENGLYSIGSQISSEIADAARRGQLR